MPLDVHYSENDRLVTIRVQGPFDFSVHRDFRDAYKDMPPSGVNYLIDLKEAEVMDSSALGMLLLLREHTDKATSIIRITNCNKIIKRVFEISKFSRLFDIS